MSGEARVECPSCNVLVEDIDWHRCATPPLLGQPSLLDAGEVFAEESAELPGETSELTGQSVELPEAAADVCIIDGCDEPAAALGLCAGVHASEAALDGYEEGYAKGLDAGRTEQVARDLVDLVAEPASLTLTASISRKVRITQYETAEVYVAVSNITRDTTDEDIAAMLEGPGAITWRRLTDAVNQKAREIREEWR